MFSKEMLSFGTRDWKQPAFEEDISSGFKYHIKCVAKEGKGAPGAL